VHRVIQRHLAHGLALAVFFIPRVGAAQDWNAAAAMATPFDCVAM
jgi:hypothetical protein